MARKDKHVTPSNISTGAERVPPTPEQEAAYEAANPQVFRQDSEAVTVDVPQEPTVDEQLAQENAEEAAEPQEQAKPKRGRSKGTQPVSLQPFEFSCLKAVWDAIPADEAWDAWVDFNNVPKDARSFLGNFQSRGLVELDIDVEEGNRIKRVRITEKGNVSVTTPKLKEPALPTKATQAKAPKVAKEPKQPAAPRGQYSNPDHRITLLVQSNPRREGTQGFYSFQLYREGMTYDDYIKSAYDNTIVCSNGSNFDGPKQVHFLWDVQHGFIGVYDSTKQPADPDYWVAKCKTMITSPGPAAPGAQPSNVTPMPRTKKEVEEAAQKALQEKQLQEQMAAEAQAEGEVANVLAETTTQQ